MSGKRNGQDPAGARPLELDPARATRADRRPYGVIDIGSNSVRLVVYDELGRAPLPRFNEKSLCRLGEGLAQTGAIAAEGFGRTVEAVRRFRAIADAMGVVRLDATATEAIRRATNGPDLVAAIAAESGVQLRVLSGAEEAHFAALGVISGFFRPIGLVGDMGGGSLEVAEALDDRVGERWVSLPLGALPAEALLAEGAGAAKRRIDAQLREGLPPALAEPVFYPVGGGWRALAKAHMAAVGAPVRVVHGYTLAAAEARAFAKKLWHLSPAKLAAPAGRAQPPRAHPAGGGTGARPGAQAPGAGAGRVLGAGPARGLALLAAAGGGALSRPAGRGRPAVRPATWRACRPSRRPWCAGPTGLFPGETPADRRLRVAVCALSDIAWRDHPDVRAEESFRRLLQFPFIGLSHAERVLLAAAIHARYVGKPDDAWLTPAIGLLPPSARRRAQILGRAILLGYRLSGGVPEILDDARLRILADQVRLEVGSAARVPDSEVVGDRLDLLAQAIGVRRTEVVELI